MSCKHPRIIINEMGTSFTNHSRSTNGEWSHFSSVGDYTGILQVYCPDCNIRRTVNKDKAPRWLKIYLSEFGVTCLYTRTDLRNSHR